MIQDVAKVVAKVDVYISLAIVASSNRYVRPTFNDEHRLHIVEGKHPIVEEVISSKNYIANDVDLDEKNRIMEDFKDKFVLILIVSIFLVFFSSFIIHLDETEILNGIVFFYYIPGENLEIIIWRSQNGEVFDRIPSEFERIGHLQHLFQQGHEIFVQGQAGGFIRFVHHLRTKLDERILPYTESHAFIFLTIARKTNQDEDYIAEGSFHKEWQK